MTLINGIRIFTSPTLPDGSCTLSSEFKGKVQPGQTHSLQFGIKAIPYKLLGFHGLGKMPSICISADILHTLMIPTPIILSLSIDSASNTWHLGPLIGIFANKITGGKSLFGEQSGFFRKLYTISQNNKAFMFVFSPDDIDWEHQIISGYIPILETKQWTRIATPFPDVVYDRGLFPSGEKRREATKARKILRNHDKTKLFNPAFFGKWKTHQLLSGNEELLYHLPATMLYNGWPRVEKMLAEHKTLYFKPTGGSSGRGILTLTYKDSEYKLKYRKFKKNLVFKTKDQTQIANTLDNMIQGKRYIIQQGLNLACSDNCPYDVRVLMQRENKGKWLLTGMAARVSGPDSFLSNIHAGGHAEKITSALHKSFNSSHVESHIISTIRRICKITAAWVTTHLNPQFGEIAIDLGIDSSGKVWIIELNAIPGRTVFRRINALKLAQKAIERPIEFSFYLAGFYRARTHKM